MKILKTKKYSLLSQISKLGFIVVIFVSLLSPFYFIGADGPVTGAGGGEFDTIKNPLKNEIDTIPKFIEEVINIVLVVGVPIIALAIIYTGFLFVKAQGNPEELTKAKKAFVYTIVGAALLLGAFVIANAIGKTVDEIKRTS